MGRSHRKILVTEERILSWADAHFKRTGKWPDMGSGKARLAPDMTWGDVDKALRRGYYGLPPGDSLARLLKRSRGKRNPKDLPRLTRGIIVAWATAHKRFTGKWPTQRSGEVTDAPGETWAGINRSLSLGARGFPGGTTLAQALALWLGPLYRDKKHGRPPLTEEQIIKWAQAHRRKTGSWPTTKRGVAVSDSPFETWEALDMALRRGGRGLPGGTTLAELLETVDEGDHAA